MIMKVTSILGSCLLGSALLVVVPAGALAVALPGTTVTGTCAVLDNTCAASDTNFSPTSVKVSVAGGVTTAMCSGTTTNKPTKTTKCDGEILGGAMGETAPLQPCTILIGTTSVHIDDWSEVITSSGKVTLLCKSSGSDTK
jgi:hypothetical protein